MEYYDSSDFFSDIVATELNTECDDELGRVGKEHRELLELLYNGRYMDYAFQNHGTLYSMDDVIYWANYDYKEELTDDNYDLLAKIACYEYLASLDVNPDCINEQYLDMAIESGNLDSKYTTGDDIKESMLEMLDHYVGFDTLSDKALVAVCDYQSEWNEEIVSEMLSRLNENYFEYLKRWNTADDMDVIASEIEKEFEREFLK